MRASELIDELNRAGATLEIVEGEARIRGARIPEALKQRLKANRDQLLAELKTRKAQGRDRYGQVPPASVPMLVSDIGVPELWKPRIMAYVLRQPRPVHAWVMSRSNHYYERGEKPDDCEWRACVDVIGWQRECGGLEAARFVVELPGPGECLDS